MLSYDTYDWSWAWFFKVIGPEVRVVATDLDFVIHFLQKVSNTILSCVLTRAFFQFFITGFRHYLGLMGLVGPDLYFSMVLVDTFKKVT